VLELAGAGLLVGGVAVGQLRRRARGAADPGGGVDAGSVSGAIQPARVPFGR